MVTVADLREHNWSSDWLYRELDGDKDAMSEFLWNAAENGEIGHKRLMGTLKRYNQNASVEGLLEFTNRFAEDEEYRLTPQYNVPGWYGSIGALVAHLHENGEDMTEHASRFEPMYESQIWANLISRELVSYEDAPQVGKDAMVRTFLANRGGADRYDYDIDYVRERAPELATQYGGYIRDDKLEYVGSIEDLDDEELAALYSNLYSLSVLEFAHRYIRPRGEPMLEILEHDARNREGRLLVWRATIGVAHGMILNELGRTDGWLDEHLSRFFLCNALAGVREYAVGVFEKIDPEKRTKWMQAAYVDAWSRSAAHQLIDLMTEEAQDEAVAYWLSGIAEMDYPDSPTERVAETGPGIVPALERYLDDASAKEAVVMANILSHIEAPESARLLVEIVGSSAKTPRRAAEQALSNFGPVALEAVREGTEAGKKAIRQFCKAQLPRLEEAAEKVGADEYPDVDVETVRSDLRYRKEPGIEFIDEHPEEVFDIVGDTLAEHADTSAVWTIVEQLPNAKDNCRKAVAVLTRMDLDKRDRNRVPGRLAYVYGNAKTASVMLERLEAGLAMGLELEFTQFVLDHKPTASQALVLESLQSETDGTRERAVKAAREIGDDIASDVVGLLESDRKDVRQAAAATLSGLDYAEWEDEIREALENEEYSDVAFELEDLLDAI